MEDHELVAIISNMVLGYREGSSADIIQAVAAIKVKAMKHEANEGVSELFDAIDRIAELKEEIMERA